MFWIRPSLDSGTTKSPIFHHSANVCFPYTHPSLLWPLWWASGASAFCSLIPALVLLHWLPSWDVLNPPSPSLFADLPASAGGEHIILLKIAGNSPVIFTKWSETVSGEVLSQWVGRRKCLHTLWKPTSGELGLSWLNGTEFNNCGFFKRKFSVFHYILFPKPDLSVSFLNRVFVQWVEPGVRRHSLISQPSYNKYDELVIQKGICVMGRKPMIIYFAGILWDLQVKEFLPYFYHCMFAMFWVPQRPGASVHRVPVRRGISMPLASLFLTRFSLPVHSSFLDSQTLTPVQEVQVRQEKREVGPLHVASQSMMV